MVCVVIHHVRVEEQLGCACCVVKNLKRRPRASPRRSNEVSSVHTVADRDFARAGAQEQVQIA